MVIRSIKQKDYFIPVMNDNKKLSANEQIKVVYKKRPSSSEVSKLILNRGDIDTFADDEHDVIREYVDKIVNCEFDTGEKITDAESLLDSQQSVLVHLIVEIVKDLVSIGEFSQGE